MQRAMIEQHLAQAERHVTQGERSLTRQRDMIAGLETHGHNSLAARQLLTQFEELQAMHVAARDRLRRELSECPE